MSLNSLSNLNHLSLSTSWYITLTVRHRSGNEVVEKATNRQLVHAIEILRSMTDEDEDEALRAV
jgi:hypothetical protein